MQMAKFIVNNITIVPYNNVLNVLRTLTINGLENYSLSFIILGYL